MLIHEFYRSTQISIKVLIFTRFTQIFGSHALSLYSCIVIVDYLRKH